MEEVLRQVIQMELLIPLIIEEILKHTQVQVQFIQFQLTLEVQDVTHHLLIITVLHHNWLHTLEVENI